MLRRTPLRRKTRLRAKGKGSYARRERDVEHMLLVKQLPCALSGVAGAGPCRGPVEADHAGRKLDRDEAGGLRKTSDKKCIPLCSGHHQDRHHAKGFFEPMSKVERQHWCVLTIARTHLLIAEKRARRT